MFSGFLPGREFITIPCGKCFGCRLMRSEAWAVRCMAEAQTAGIGRCWFVTVTYAPEHNPVTLLPRDHTLFVKRLRKEFPGVRFYMCGEYGDQKSPLTGFGRPHFHYLFFGLDLPDLARFGGSDSHPTYTSATLTRIWGKGHVVVGLVEEQSAKYVSGYIQKKRMGKGAEEFYSVSHPVTGEPFKMHPEFSRMSLKPGIGAEWFARWHRDVYPADKVPRAGGRFVKPPPYYDELYSRIADSDPSLPPLDEFKKKRLERRSFQADDLTDARLKVREACAVARAKFFANRKL